MRIVRTLRHLLTHPLGRRDKIGTLKRFIRWQIGSRTLDASIAMPFVNGIRLLARTGMHGATGNLYVGLMEFEDMAFVLHLLRKGDSFIDVGANVGVYSLLAARQGARVIALEPVPETYEQLLDNIYLNRLHTQVDARNLGVSSTRGKLRFSTQTGATNHVVTKEQPCNHAVTVTVDTLEEIAAGMTPTMIKIDVEGFETEVIRGATSLLAQESLQAVLIELNGLGSRYGFNDDNIHIQLKRSGFTPMHYNPFSRRLTTLKNYRRSGNTLYVRSSTTVDDHLRKAPRFVWQNISI